MFRGEFARRGLAPQALSTAVENSGTVTSVLVPWNSCGAYIAGVLGVATVEYLPYAFFCFLSPILAVIFGYTGFKVERIEPAARRSAHRNDRDGPSLPRRRACR